LKKIGGRSVLANEPVAAVQGALEQVEMAGCLRCCELAHTFVPVALRVEHPKHCGLHRVRHEDQPAIELRTVRRRQVSLRVAVGEIEQDRRGLGEDEVTVDERRHHAERVERQVRRVRLSLVALDPHELVLDADLRKRRMRCHRSASWTPVQTELRHARTAPLRLGSAPAPRRPTALTPPK
jgi:hypothetical protein